MTIPTTEALYSGPYAGDGVVVTFDYDFKIYAETELYVVRLNADQTEETLALTDDYTVSGVGDAGGGSITLTAGSKLPVGASMTIEPAITMSQERPFATQSSTTLAQIELALDKLTSLVRRLLGLSNRSFKVSVATLEKPFTPSIAGTPAAEQMLIVNSSGTGLQWEDITTVLGNYTHRADADYGGLAEAVETAYDYGTLFG